MARRAFDIDTIPPPPLSTEETAAKYGVSKTALNDIKSFVAAFVSEGEEPNGTEWAIRRKKKVGPGFRFEVAGKVVGRPRASASHSRSRAAGSSRRAGSRKK